MDKDLVAASYRTSTGSPSFIPPPVPVTDNISTDNEKKKGRSINESPVLLSERDERILLEKGIRITDHLGAGFFGNVWKGQYTANATTTHNALNTTTTTTPSQQGNIL